MSPETFELFIMPLLIFLARICDVSLGTLRIILVSRGHRFLAPIIGFVEILIWVSVITHVMQNLDHWGNFIGYAAGFATGNYIGIILESKLAMGVVLLRIITRKRAVDLITYLRAGGHSVTNVAADSSEGPVEIIFLPVRRKEVEGLIDQVKKFNPTAMYTIEDVRDLSTGALPPMSNRRGFGIRPFRYMRKSK